MCAFFLSATGDEIDADPAVQVACLQQNGIARLDVRSAWGKPVQDLTDDETAQLKHICAAANIAIQSVVGTLIPLPLTQPLSESVANLERLIVVARQFGTSRIRLTSGEIPPHTRSADYMFPAIQRLRHLAQMAETAGITLLIENAPGTAGDIPGNIHSILHGAKSSHVRMAWNPGYFVQAGVSEQVTEYQGMLLKYVGDVCIHDATVSDKQACLPGEGNGQLRELLILLRAGHYDSTITLQPGLTQSGNLNGAEAMRLAATMLRAILVAAGIKL